MFSEKKIVLFKHSCSYQRTTLRWNREACRMQSGFGLWGKHQARHAQTKAVVTGARFCTRWRHEPNQIPKQLFRASASSSRWPAYIRRWVQHAGASVFLIIEEDAIAISIIITRERREENRRRHLMRHQSLSFKQVIICISLPARGPAMEMEWEQGTPGIFYFQVEETRDSVRQVWQ